MEIGILAPKLHLIARSQGVATLARVFRDEKFIRQEVRQLLDGVNALVRREEPEP